jgi:hypothetical protein
LSLRAHPTKLFTDSFFYFPTHDWFINHLMQLGITRHQFHQHFLRVFFVQMLFRQLFLRLRNVHVTRQKVAETTIVRKKRA